MFILALKEQTLTYTVVIAVMHVAWILWITASGREVVHKLENHVYRIYPKKNTLRRLVTQLMQNNEHKS